VLSVLLILRLRGTKLVVWLQNDADLDPARAKGGYTGIIGRTLSHTYTWLLKRADLLISQTQSQYKAARHLGAGNVMVVRSIAASPWRAQPDRTGLAQNEGWILWAGNMTPNKRMRLVFELANKLPEQRFAVAVNPGDVRMMADAERAAAGCGNVCFLGSLATEEMERWFDRATLVLNTSVVEGFPNSFLQAWIRGLPVISAGVDPDGIISKYGLGAVVAVKQGDAAEIEKLASRTRAIMTDSSLRQTLGQAGLAYVKANHSPEVIGKQLDEALSELLHA
jgi:glycosyltransferase involved in cell wall biosynthesis